LVDRNFISFKNILFFGYKVQHRKDTMEEDFDEITIKIFKVKDKSPKIKEILSGKG
jgi:hypothetical protein